MGKKIIIGQFMTKKQQERRLLELTVSMLERHCRDTLEILDLLKARLPEAKPKEEVV